jgi:LacI family transcriptional regulator
MIARIKDVAQLAGVSTATVSHVINSTRYVSDEVKKKVYDAMKQLNYSPNPVARSLRSRKSNIIGLIVPIKGNDNSNNFFMSVANGIESVLKKHHYHLILSNSREKYEEELERIQMFNNQWIDGLILAPTTQSEEHKDMERTFGDYPVVFIDRKPKHLQGDCVLINGFDGSYQAVKALLAKGHTRIGFISGGLHVSSVEERLMGYRKALQEKGIEPDASLIKSGESLWTSGYDLTHELITNENVTALFVANNVMCMGTMKYLREKRIQIPDRMALVCYDDYEWTGVIDPPLSVVRQPAYQLGEKAAEILLHRIENRNGKIKEYRLPAELIVRDSY